MIDEEPFPGSPDDMMNTIDALRAHVAQLEAALKEARRFMEYFAEGRTSFVGSGTPQTCLAQIDAALKDAPQ